MSKEHEVLVAHLRECAKADPSENTYSEAANAIEELTAEIERLKNERRWIPVTERLPEFERDVLAFCVKGEETRIAPCVYVPHNNGQFYDCVFRCYAEGITHWMPLPEPPEEETNART